MSDGKIPADIDQIATRIALRFLGGNVSCEAIYRDVSEALLAERSANEAEVERLSRCLTASDARTDENFTVAVSNAFDTVGAKARIAELEKALAEIVQHPIATPIIGRQGIPGWPSCQDIARAALAEPQKKTAT